MFPFAEPEHIFEVGKTTISCQRNPNKATIFPDKDHIIIDENFSKIQYRPALSFVLGHEISHYRYSDESKCDLASANFMLGNGYNPSQIKISFDNLFKNNPARLHFLNSHFAEMNFLR
jgi:hypothetical protein